MATTVLIVDDHPSFRACARSVLESEGYAVVGEAVDGRQAVLAAERLRPALVLLDVHLPDCTGFEVAAELGANGAAPAIVLTSSRDGSDFGPLVGECGACGFIAKDELSGASLATLLA